MEKVNKKDDALLNQKSRKEILERLGQEELLKIFDDYKPNYKPISRKKSPLDQQIALGISKKEREDIAAEMKKIKKTGEDVTVSSLVRSRAVAAIDLEEWKERAEMGLKELNSIKWDKDELEKGLRNFYSQIDNLPDDDDESRIVIGQKIEKYKAMLEELSRPTIRRSSRMSGRVTYNEANLIRWRASRLTLTVADYMRLAVFGYVPFSENDRHLSVNARRRFYVAILDIVKNGWGAPEEVEECPNCARYADENQELRAKLARVSTIT